MHTNVTQWGNIKYKLLPTNIPDYQYLFLFV